MSIKWAIIFLLLFALASVGAGFIKGAIQQRRINKKAAKNAPPEEKSSDKDTEKKPADKKPAEKKPKEKPQKKPEVKRPKRLDGGPAEKPEDAPKQQ